MAVARVPAYGQGRGGRACGPGGQPSRLVNHGGGHEDIRSGAALERTVPILKATGYRLDMEFWESGAGAGCCPPECSTIGD
nr:hypothetical protein GCM10010200_030640 [Actinomadura rugatobispora]